MRYAMWSAEVISEFFTQFGEVTVDWPHREYTRGNIPPNGYAFVLFKNGTDVEKLVSNCTEKVGRLSIMLTRDGQPLKAVQVRPWKVMSQYCIYRQGPISTRYAVFVGGVPRTVTASQLAAVVYQTFGEVLAVTISVENGTRYPKGAARVIFGTREAYTKAIAAHFLKMKFAEQEKDVSTLVPSVVIAQIAFLSHPIYAKVADG
ncbi:unnamed protein product [Toxocara canis]|uniref:RRM domain-containing protein n=1 Tax=Toxocara canis TaxID=6265 RepID=A0A183UJ60_TOXCA|nr:unnamed protein product [Toxocara canis]